MKLVEAEAEGPVEGDAALVTPPRPPHRRVSVSLVFTMSVLVGVVVAIYAVFPPRHDVLVTEAIAAYRESSVPWDLEAPSAGELRGWATGVVGKDVGKDPPLPPDAVRVRGARRIEVLHRGAALIAATVGGDDVILVIARARGIAPESGARDDGDVRAIAWRRGAFSLVAVGAAKTADAWAPALGAR